MIPKQNPTNELPSITPPRNLEEAERLRLHLVSKIEEITAQLGNKNKIDANGARIPSQDWWRWRQSAIYALRYKQSQLRELKLWISTEKERRWFNQKPNAERLLRVVKDLLVTLEEEDVLNPEEYRVLEDIEEYLDGALASSDSSLPT